MVEKKQQGIWIHHPELWETITSNFFKKIDELIERIINYKKYSLNADMLYVSMKAF